MIPLFKPHTPQELNEPLLETLHSGYITQGDKVDEFEYEVGQFLGTDNVVSLNSGTSALTLALRLAGVGPGDEVITTPMTCTATNLPILASGATPVFCDVDPISGNINADKIEKLVSKKTKAIMFVDWGGMPADLDEIMAIAKKHDLKVIEDAAHAFGAEYKGKKVGTIAHFTCFSLQAIKHITTGDGGLLTCKYKKDFDRAKVLRWFGIDRSKNGLDSRIDQDIEEWGYKFHMNDLAATMGIVQMNFIHDIIEGTRKNANEYGRQLNKYFVRVFDSKDRRSAWWLYTVLLADSRDRDDFKRYMDLKGIQVSQVHKRNDHYTVFKDYVPEGTNFDGLDYFADRMIALPVYASLDSYDRSKIISACNEFAKMKGSA